MLQHVAPQVGAPDPELGNSPIPGDGNKGLDAYLKPESGVCHFDDVACPIGQHIPSGDELRPP